MQDENQNSVDSSPQTKPNTPLPASIQASAVIGINPQIDEQSSTTTKFVNLGQ